MRRVDGTNMARYEWLAGEVLHLVYNGTYWVSIDGGIATTTYFGATKLATSAVSTSTSLALTPASLNSLAQYMLSGVAVYSTSSTYAVGDRVRYGYYIYECTTAITTAEAWNAAHWTALDSFQEQIDALASQSGSGDVSGPSSSTDGNIAVFDGTTGKQIKDSGANIDEFVLAVSPGTQSSATPLNADTLNSHTDSYFATASGLSDLSQEVDTVQSDITSIQTALDTKAPLNSPTLTGTPTAPTASSGTNNTQIATTAFVKNAVSEKVNLSGDTMTGVLIAQNNTSYTTKQVRNITLSTSSPSGGSNGDIWIVYTE